MTDAALLQLRNVTKGFAGAPVLRDLSLTIREGERRGLIGPNGAGKTTLINVVTGKHRPDAGDVLFRGKSISDLPPHRRNRLGIAQSFQILSLFRDMTVRENLRNAALRRDNYHLRVFKGLTSSTVAEKMIIQVADMIGLRGVLDVVTNHLTYGMQRRLDIGLVLAQDPDLMILDEPAAGLTAAETRELVDVLKVVVKGRTLILVEHDMDVVYALSDLITVLDYGRVAAEGVPEDINVNPTVRRLYLGEDAA